MNLFIGLFLVLALSGCATKKVRYAYSNGGADVYEASCPGTRNSITDCYAQASRFCESGKFKAVTEESNSSELPVNGTYLPAVKRVLAFTCE